MKHTLHANRLDFVLALKNRLGNDLDLFGRGFNPVDDKAKAMDAYRYHIAIENHVQPGHITEKLTDCFLAGCLPFYFGAPDYADHFPAESVIPINIFDLDGTIEIIKTAIESKAYEIRRPAINEARNIALTRWNTIEAAALAAFERYLPNAKPRGEILGRHAFRRAHPVKAFSDALFVAKARRSPAASPIQTKFEDSALSSASQIVIE